MNALYRSVLKRGVTLFRGWWRSVFDKWFTSHDTAGTDAAPQVVPSACQSDAGSDHPVSAGLAGAAQPMARIRRKETLASLLDEIAETFTALRLPVEMTWLQHDTRIALRRMGPHIASEENEAAMYKSEARIDPSTPLSSLMCVSLANKKAREKQKLDPDWMATDLMFAVKLQKSPHNVEPNDSGPVYEVGIAWRTYGKKHIWGKWYVGVDRKTGVLRALRERWDRQVKVGRGAYMQRVYQVPPWFADTEKEREAGRVMCAQLLAFTLAFWHVKDKHWKVSVRRGKDRVTWCVPFTETKHYFADRDRTVLTKSGSLAKIIHYVREHDRVVRNKTVTVKEHLRGLRQFTWKDYECAITAPKFHTFTANAFDISGVDEEEIVPGNVVRLSEGGKMLADLEDRQAA